MCGFSTGFVYNMRVSMQPDKAMRIANTFPDINIGWLLTGEGEMIKRKNQIFLKTYRKVFQQKNFLSRMKPIGR